MKRTANVAYALHGQDNVNRLRVPAFGVAKLVIKTAHKTSKSHQPAGAGHPPSSNDGADGFHFAPEKEAADIVYEVVDPLGAIRGAKLELFCRHKAAALWTLDLATFGATWWSHGAHTIAWDGRIVQPDHERAGAQGAQGYQHDLKDITPVKDAEEFPDGYVNLKHTVYKLKMTLEADGVTGDPAVAWTYFLVLAEKLTLEFGPPEVLPAAVAGKGDHRAVRTDLVAREATPPKASDGKTVKVFLDSDLYKASANEMFDNTLFGEYEALWGDGPLLPLVAKVTLLDSQDHGVEAPKGIGRVKFLWDWESKSAAAATGKHSDAFINHAQDYDADTTKPKGQNCYVRRGGKRGKPSAVVFPPQAGYQPKDALDDGVFPFEVEAVSDNRKWAAWSYAWRDKALAGKTGVLFQPSRMAGDAYAVTVYLAWDVDKKGKPLLDTDAQPLSVPAPEKVSDSTGTLQIWRRTHLRKHLAKRAAGMPALDLGAIAGCFADAFVEVVNAAGATQTIPEADWNGAISTAVGGWDATTQLVLDLATQHAGGATGVVFRTRDDFAQRWRKRDIESSLTGIGLSAADAAAVADAASAAASGADAFTAAEAEAVNVGYTDPADQANIATEAQGQWESVGLWVDDPANGWDTPANYANSMEQKAIALLTEIFNSRFDADPGVTIFQVETPHSLCGDQAGYTIGLAHDFAAVRAARPSRCGFLLMCPAGQPPCGLDKISAHEIGHHFFLPHPTDTAECAHYHAHDRIVPSECLMSYNYTRAMHLCGFCQLRLRGWDKAQLKTDGSANKRP